MSLAARNLIVRLGQRQILNGISLTLPAGAVTAIIGPNGCGKSTLLRTLGGLIAPEAGQVTLEDSPIATMRRATLAQRLTLLPQAPIAPEGLRVGELVMRGRTPWMRPFRPASAADHAAVSCAMDATGITDLVAAKVANLSGGQRQRAWIAMALAQDTNWLLLDEPTTWLDLRHQLEILHLIRRLNRDEDRSVVMVLHDISLAARFADHIIAIADGQIAAEGAPGEVIVPPVLSQVFGLSTQIIVDPLHGSPLVLTE